MSEAAEWDAAYQRDEAPPWDIGRPQPAFVALAERGLFTGDLLESGCGTGEHTLLAAQRGARATGIDLSATAIETARSKAVLRGIPARFMTGDMLDPPFDDASFDTVLDMGVFHVFDDTRRPVYVASLSRLTKPGGVCHLICFSEHQPGDWGPRRVTQAELHAAFDADWEFEELEAARLAVNETDDATEVRAWRAMLRRR
jgi:SAM-dependent methyltransferase